MYSISRARLDGLVDRVVYHPLSICIALQALAHIEPDVRARTSVGGSVQIAAHGTMGVEKHLEVYHTY